MDALRYRWLRENISDDGQFFMVGRVLRSPDDFDAAIDDARGFIKCVKCDNRATIWPAKVCRDHDPDMGLSI